MDREAALALLEATHRFPSEHFFQIIVRQTEDDVAAVLDALAAHVALPNLDDRVVRVPSRKGTYVSLRLTLPCESAEAVLAVYARISEIPGIINAF